MSFINRVLFMIGFARLKIVLALDFFSSKKQLFDRVEAIWVQQSRRQAAQDSYQQAKVLELGLPA